MGSLAPDEFEDALLELVAPWLPAGKRIEVVICGMAGARQGWREAPYRAVPCAPVQPDAQLVVETKDPRLAVRIVSGLSQIDPPDVMRGEETQIAGLLAADPEFAGTVCLPGTHSKWVTIRGGQVLQFRTFLTGELFAYLSQSSILRHTIPAEGVDEDDFVDAVTEAAADPAAMPGKLFALRAGPMLDVPPARNLRSRLSGLLIGAEIAAVRDQIAADKVYVVGGESVAGPYAKALGALGLTAALLDAETLTIAGLQAARAGQGAP